MNSMVIDLMASIYISNFDGSTTDIQMCYLPVELMSIKGVLIGNYIYLKVDKAKGILCKAFPTHSSYYSDGYQMLATYHVIHNVSYINEICSEKEMKIDVKDVFVLKSFKVKVLNINIIMDSSEHVTIAKTQNETFKDDVHTLLKIYQFRNNTIINCLANPLAKLLGISYIMIKEVNVIKSDEDLLENWIGKITSSTSIHIGNIESRERHLFLIERPALLGGLDDILNDLKSLVNDPWECKKEFAEAGTIYPKGVLLIGPPGCGKSSVARQLCHETQACLVATAGAEIKSPFKGGTICNFSNVAKKAFLLSKEGPCIFFIDEIDSICPIRSQELSIEDLQLSAQVLLVFDECQKYPHLLVLAATNRPFALDPAARRSGRLEIEILLNTPTLQERRDILSIHSKGLLLHDDPHLLEAAKATPGFVGADLQFLCDRVREELTEESSHRVSSNYTPTDVLDTMIRLCTTITPSIHKTLEWITTKPKPSAIGGLDDIRKKLDLLFTMHTKYSKFCSDFHLKRPRGILLYGPRGCGKTRLVSLLASQKGFTFLSANASHLLSPFVGDSEKRVAALFHSARMAQPSIVFIDEIDGIFGCRDEVGGGVRVNLLTELLQAMDGADVSATSLQGSSMMGNKTRYLKDDIIVCAATNNPHKLDSALLRPGRFDHIIYVPPPDRLARIDILKLKSSKLQISEECLQKVADISEGWTGAELENLITQASFRSVLEGHVREEITIYVPDEILMAEFNKFTPTLTKSEITFFKDFSQNLPLSFALNS